MDKIASPRELVVELQGLMRAASEPKPSREDLAEELYKLASRVTDMDPSFRRDLEVAIDRLMGTLQNTITTDTDYRASPENNRRVKEHLKFVRKAVSNAIFNTYEAAMTDLVKTASKDPDWEALRVDAPVLSGELSQMSRQLETAIRGKDLKACTKVLSRLAYMVKELKKLGVPSLV